MRKLALIVLAMFVTSVAMAQVTTSSMSGKITDASGQPLIGAAVVAIHTPSGTQYGTAVDLNGNYRILNMRPGGPYTVAVQMLGYHTTEYQGIELALGDNYVLDAEMFESALGMEEIVVRGVGRDNMNTDRAGAITTVNANKMAMQPTTSRSLNDIIKLSPQSATTSNGLAIGGGNYRQSYVTVDGAAFNNAFGIGSNLPAGGSPISIDALDQMTVSVTPYDVRQSGFTGGAINAVTKSGDNEFKASVYSYFNNDNFKGYKIKNEKFDRDEQKNNMYGITFGGPIIKNKLFFFVNAEMEREISPGPTTRARESANDTWGGGTNNNRPTVSDMDMMREYLRNKYGYDPGIYQGYSLNTPSWKLLARVDWNIHENHKLNVRFSTTHSKYSSSPSSSVNPVGSSAYPKGGSRTGNTAMYYKNTRYWQEQNFTSVAAELNSVFGPVTNTLRVTYSHQDEPRSWDGGTFPTVDILSDVDNSDNVPYTTFGLDPFTYGNLRDVKTFIVTDDVNWTWGINNLTAGFQFEFDRTKNGYMQAGAGWYVYESWDDFVNDRTPYTFAITHSNREDLAQIYPSFDYQQYSIYLQDKIDISNNFKLTAGIRLEIPTFPSLKDNYNPEFASLKFNGKSYSTDQMPKARVQVSPRVGFNWDVMGDRRHVIRGGTGIFTGRLPFVWIVSAVGNSNVQQTSYSYYNPSVNNPSRIPGFHTNISDILDDLYGGNFNPSNIIAPQNPTIMDKNLKMPSTWKTSLAYDVRLPGDVFGSLEGIYNRDINSVVVTNLGLKDPTENGLRVSANDIRDYYNPDDLYYATNSEGSDVKPYLIENINKNGWYYSITAKLERSFSFGMSVMAAYTYSDSRTLTDGIGDQVTSAWSTNNYSVNGVNNHSLSYGSYVAPHRVIAALDFRIKKNTSLGLFYEGSNLGYYGSSSYTYTRFSYTYTTNIVGDGGASNLLYVPASKDELTFIDYADGSYSAADQAEDFWAYVNQDKYLKSRKGQYAERNGAKMPWRSRFDLKYVRDFDFVVGGRTNTLQLGVDIINVANLINRKWGNMKTVNNATPLAVVTDANKDIIGFRFQKNGSETLTKTFSPVARSASTYAFQFSLRYIFN
ncbi:MAG: carboxypeptidase regulatory-like domain-containing protein [Alistipes sp.]|nr:carboxypeptidase regulatory-like domain-containing protein [Alistipes sp.]